MSWKKFSEFECFWNGLIYDRVSESEGVRVWWFRILLDDRMW